MMRLYPAALAALSLATAPAAHAQISGLQKPADFTANTNGIGTTYLSNNSALITDSEASESHSPFYTTPQFISSFTATFTYTNAGGGERADGMAFVLQNDLRGANALGLPDINIGSGVNKAISPSAAVEFRTYNSNGT